MPQGLFQRSFAGGELTPAIAARADVTKYQTGLKTCRNFIVMKHGGVANRAGTEFICEVKDSSKATRLLKFVFNDAQTYVLEFGEDYMRIVQDSVQLTVGPLEAWASDQDYVIGDLASYSGTDYYCIAPNGVSSTTQQPDTAPLFWYALPAYTGSGTATSIYEIPTPYQEDELFTIYSAQSADIVTLCHKNHPPHELTRTGDTTWTLQPTKFAPDMDAPLEIQASGPAGAIVHKYQVTAVKKDTFEESLPGSAVTSCTGTISDQGVLADLEVECTEHGYETGDLVKVLTVVANDANEYNLNAELMLEDRVFVVTKVDLDTYRLDDTQGVLTLPITYTTWPVIQITTAKAYAEVTAAEPTESAPIAVSWNAVAGAIEYWIYKEDNGIYGFLGSASNTTSFEDIGDPPDIEEVAPQAITPFKLNDWPGVVGFYQQRQVYASTLLSPQKVWMSRAGDLRNFTTNSPLQDDDAIIFTIAGTQVNEIRHLLNIGQLHILTRGSSWLVRGDSDGVVRPTAINLEPQQYSGAYTVPPVLVQESALYVQARGTAVRDLLYSFQTDKHAGRDLTIFATHLFDVCNSCEIADWDYAEIPNSVVWTVRTDGVLLGLTYVREHDIWAWHRHDTFGTYQGEFESVVTVPEGAVDAPYFVVQRYIDGGVKRYIERLQSRCGRWQV
jgi:hypothetical protein